MGMTFEDIEVRLMPEAERLFNAMAEAHLASSPGHRFFMVSQALGSGPDMMFAGDSQFHQPGFDESTVQDLLGYGLLRYQGSHQYSTSYNIPADGIHFYNWLQAQRGEPVESVERVAVTSLSDGGLFARTHPKSAHHLEQALELVRSDAATEDQVASEIGGHLRSALIDLTVDLTGATTKPEEVSKNLKAWLATRSATRQSSVVAATVELCIATQHLNQRVTHIRDDVSKGEPALTWEEIRRSAFATVYCCYELSRL